MTGNTYLRERVLLELKEIILDKLSGENARVYLFGSWARKEERQSSDIDIAIECSEIISPKTWNDLLESIEESSIPYRVDIVDIHTANSALVNNIKEEGILWKDYANE
ncbi:nucleotidyltransferase domain-containing protein [Evansella sp. AB-P1]|uniref:nucleotidyltransferase family protein n=1 Tax=Evansella sp. AB-P1 TaxID=3037653 RepID=UPI00241C1C39|nr:nucleotidyltransferase domain-containing protein [Evansella sp. AB-P1]MDG5789880.1 nucleotidyltransferase domain-containing protein [Evansella sp. AB-P1]